MPTQVTIDTNQAETEVTITTNDASTNYTISAGARGPEGPNSITTATLSNLTGFISANGTTVSGATAGSTAATPSTLVLRNANGGVVFTSTTNDAALLATGNNATAGNFQSVSATAVNISSSTGIGAGIGSSTGTGASISSGTGTAATIESGTGDHLNIGGGKVIVANNGNTTLTGAIAASNLSGTNTGDQFTSVTSQRLIGRHAGGAGAAQEVQVGDGIEFQGSGIRRSALTGDITASAGSNTTALAATIAGAKTLSGQLELTGQAATDVNSAMTRSLSDARYGAIGLAGLTATTITNNATLQTIRSTSLAIGFYHVRMVFLLAGTANTGTRHGYNFSGSGTPRFFRSRASSAPFVQITGLTQDLGLAESATSAVIEGILQVTAAGTLAMQAAQNTSHADALSVAASNHMIITPCAIGSIS